MSFFLDFWKDRIAMRMEDPADRDRRWEEHLRGVQRSAATAKSNMSHPTKNWGFWRTDKHNGKYELNADPAVSKMPGRRAANLAE